MPTRLGMPERSPAVMVACGRFHSVVVTADGGVCTFGAGGDGRLGHGNEIDQLKPARFDADKFQGAHMVMAAAGASHVAVSSQGHVFTFGHGANGRLGHKDLHDKLVPTKLQSFGTHRVVIVVAAGLAHTVAVTEDGELWAWGRGGDALLALGDLVDHLTPVLVGGADVFGGSSVLMAACGDVHTLALTVHGAVYSWGCGEHGILGHGDCHHRLLPTCIAPHLFEQSDKVVTVSACETHSAAVTQDGRIFTWGRGETYKGSCVSAGLGHADFENKLVPTPIAAHHMLGARVGRCHSLPTQHMLAFAMGTHIRLGNHCEFLDMPGDLVERLIAISASWPEGRAGELHGVVRLAGGFR